MEFYSEPPINSRFSHRIIHPDSSNGTTGKTGKLRNKGNNNNNHHSLPNLAPAKFLSDFQYPPQKSRKNPVSVADTHTPE